MPTHEQQAQVRTMLSASLAAVVTQTLVRKERGPGPRRLTKS